MDQTTMMSVQAYLHDGLQHLRTRARRDVRGLRGRPT